ncbi:MAG: hypothetical protein PHP98_03215 [Kiritimatiellae bacterium]|jgi:hypothetical protein|nr:hypothetical protein [Kiritimatiellia bacterium]
MKDIGDFFSSQGLALGLLALSVLNDPFKRPGISRLTPAKPFSVKFGDKFGQWRLPGLLPVIRETPEFLRIKAEFSRHLNVGMRQMEFISRFHPRLILRG